MSNGDLVIQYRVFVVGDRPYCLWDTDISKRTLEFLDSIDPLYFEYIADAHLQAAVDKKSQPAAMLIRSSYSQALETLFALLCAMIQAPRCVPAWMTTYSIADLRHLVQTISTQGRPLAQVIPPRFSWQSLSDIVHSTLVLEDKEKEARIKQNFANAWGRFAYDFLDDEVALEYNSIKHGLRARPGGFHLAIGMQESQGSPAPPERMRLLGKSDFGSSFPVRERFEREQYHIRLRRHHRNWDPEDLAWGLKIASMSINNIVSTLRVLNNVPPSDVEYCWPDDEEAFSHPWQRLARIGVTSMKGFEVIIPHELIKPFKKEEILQMYTEGNNGGAFRFVAPASQTHDDPSEVGHDQGAA